jgi:hypothetical protein
MYIFFCKYLFLIMLNFDCIYYIWVIFTLLLLFISVFSLSFFKTPAIFIPQCLCTCCSLWEMLSLHLTCQVILLWPSLQNSHSPLMTETVSSNYNILYIFYPQPWLTMYLLIFYLHSSHSMWIMKTVTLFCSNMNSTCLGTSFSYIY